MASDQVAKRLVNQYAILRELNTEAVLRRTELSRRLNVRKSSVTSIVGGLLEKGVLREERPGNVRSAVGLNYDSFYAAVSGVSCRGIQFARVNLRGEVTRYQTVSFRGNEKLKAVIARIASGLNEIVHDGDGGCLGYGVTVSGGMDKGQGSVFRDLTLHAKCGNSLVEQLKVAMGTEVCVAHDIRSRLWSCAWFDEWSQHFERILYLFLSEGVASALLIRETLNGGQRLYSGEIGHVSTGADGRLCSCGLANCLEAYCSVPSMISDVAAVCPDLKVEEAIDLARQAVEASEVSEVLNEAMRHLARALSGVTALFDPSVVVLGSQSSELSCVLRPMLERHLRDEKARGGADEVEVRAVEGSHDVALRGIAGFVIDRAYATGEFSVLPK
ncbi:MAG: ROK family transcriptional regulator [Kiritimatiellae bacterium]|nr:ROK family transcriptional regulator [Kiritimatiellia bacterium]